MTTITYTSRRKGKVTGRSSLRVEGRELTGADFKAVGDEAARQSKADEAARHTGRKAYRKKKAEC